MLYAAAIVWVQGLMSINSANRAHVRRAALALSLFVLGGGLAGCAGLGDSAASGAFVDPAKYSSFDCKQLEAERNALAARTADLQRLIDKAETGVAGGLVGTIAYRNDYISVRASAKLVEQNWVASKCVETPVTAPEPSRPRRG